MSASVLFDFDDTLVETTILFNRAKNRFARTMTELGFPAEDVLLSLDMYDIKNVEMFGGFLGKCFPLAIGQTYEHYCGGKNGSSYSESIRRELENLGWWVLKQPSRPIHGAIEVLQELSKNCKLFLITKGDPVLQRQRINQSGLSGWFNQAYVLKDKNTGVYQAIACEQQITATASWVVGNSMKSDINPALRAGFNCIYIHHPHTWEYEDEEPLGGHVSVRSIRDVVSVIIS